MNNKIKKQYWPTVTQAAEALLPVAQSVGYARAVYDLKTFLDRTATTPCLSSIAFRIMQLTFGETAMRAQTIDGVAKWGAAGSVWCRWTPSWKERSSISAGVSGARYAAGSGRNRAPSP